MKYAFFALFFVFIYFLIPFSESQAEILGKSSFPLTITNPNPQNNPEGAFFPGFRGGNQLIKYTPVYGNYTDTNEYGSEITVIDGIVQKKSGANSVIPEQGYVLSGHGTAKAWLNKNIIVGTQINIENNVVTAFTTPQSYIYRAENMIEDAQTHCNYQQSCTQYLEDARKKLISAEQFLSTNHVENMILFANQAYQLAEKAYYQTIPVPCNEHRGVWVRPKSTQRSDIAKELDRLKSYGFNSVYLETFYHGYTIYPSKVASSYGFKAQRPEFTGTDMLSIWLEEAHKRGMTLHVWFETFYVGTSSPGNILSIKPSWANIQRAHLENPVLQPSSVEPGAFFIDPANKDATTYLRKIIYEIVTTYPVDGINLDYIRYPNSLKPHFPDYLDSTWGYSCLARKDFKKRYGSDPYNLKPDDKEWGAWLNYRQENVTQFVKSVDCLLKKQSRPIELSAVIFPNEKEAKIQKLQNWYEWLANGYLNALTPIILGSSPEQVEKATREIASHAKGKAALYVGVFGVFNQDDPITLVKQIVAARNAGAEGINVFDAAHVTEKYKEALIEGVFKPNPED